MTDTSFDVIVIGAGPAGYPCAIRAAQNQTAENTAPGTALVLASVYQSERQANEIVLRDKLGIHLRTRTSRQQRPGLDGFMAGQAYGDRIQLNKQIRG